MIIKIIINPMILEHKHEEEGVFDMLEIKLSSKLNRVWWDQRKGDYGEQNLAQFPKWASSLLLAP